MDGDFAVLHLHEHLGRGTHNLESVKFQIIHVWRRIDCSQRPVNLEWVSAGLASHALANHGLNDVSCNDVLAGLVDHAFIKFRRDVRLDGRVLHYRPVARFRHFYRGVEPSHDVIYPLRRLGVSPLDVAVEMRVAHDFNFVPQMVEYHEGRCQHKYRVWDADRVGFGRGQFFEVTHGVVGQISDRATVEPLRAWNVGHRVLGQFIFDGFQGVHFAILFAFSGSEHFCRLCSNEAISCYMFSALNALKQE